MFLTVSSAGIYSVTSDTSPLVPCSSLRQEISSESLVIYFHSGSSESACLSWPAGVALVPQDTVFCLLVCVRFSKKEKKIGKGLVKDMEGAGVLSWSAECVGV